MPMTTSRVESVGSSPTWTAPRTSVNRPRTLVSMKWRPTKATSACAGSTSHLPGVGRAVPSTMRTASPGTMAVMAVSWGLPRERPVRLRAHAHNALGGRRRQERAHARFAYAADMSGEPDGVAAWAALLRVHAAVVPKLERALAAQGMPLSWYDVLLELNAAPGRQLRMSELGARVVLSRERVSRVVDELERAGLVRRERNPDDKRSLLAIVTSQGRARLRAAAPTYLAGIDRHYTRHLGADEIKVIRTALGRVLEAEDGLRLRR